jgi:putative endonuclease
LGFTSKYKINRLVYYEVFADPVSAIEREKQIKGGSRAKKLSLINTLNPNCVDLYQEDSGEHRDCLALRDSQ